MSKKKESQAKYCIKLIEQGINTERKRVLKLIDELKHKGTIVWGEFNSDDFVLESYVNGDEKDKDMEVVSYLDVEELIRKLNGERKW